MLGSTSIPLWVVHGALHSSEKSCGEPYCFLFIMVRHGGKSFSDVYMCIHRTIGGFMNVVCVLFFFFSVDMLLVCQLFFALFWHGFCSCGCVCPVYWSYWLIVLMGLHGYPRMTWGFQIGIRRGCDEASGSLVRLFALLFSSLPTQGVLYVSLKSLLLG